MAAQWVAVDFGITEDVIFFSQHDFNNMIILTLSRMKC